MSKNKHLTVVFLLVFILTLSLTFSIVAAHGNNIAVASESDTADVPVDGNEPYYGLVDFTLHSFTNENYTGAKNQGDKYKNVATLIVESQDKRAVDGKDYYGDYVNFHFISNAKENEKIPNDNKRRISWDTQRVVSTTALGRSGSVDVNGQVGCGVMYIRRITAVHPEGQEFFVHKIFGSTGYRDFNQYFKEEGSYEIAIYFETYEWGFLGIAKKDFQRHVLTYKFDIRRTDSKISLIDNELDENYIQKDFMTGSKNFSVSFNGNKFLTVEYERREVLLDNNGNMNFDIVKEARREILDGHNFNNLEGVSLFIFYVKNEAYNTEQFQILVDTTRPNGTFSNLRRVIDFDSLEVEDNTRLIWDASAGMGIYAKYKPVGRDANSWLEYVNGQPLNTSNATSNFEICLRTGASFDNWSQEVRYFVTIVPADAPTRNKDFLENAHRFNNMKTQWYEVRDFANNEVYAVSIYDSEAIDTGKLYTDSYINHSGEAAYQMAMSIELEQFVTEKTLSAINLFKDNAKLAAGEVPVVGNYWEYFDRSNGKTEIYFNRVKLTYAMTVNAKANIILKTWDIADGDELKNFHESLFDGTAYLNRDFIFSSKHPTEAEKISILKDGDDTPIEIFYNFNTYNGVGYIKVEDLLDPAGLYRLTDGLYQITETDSLGNSSIYSVIIDQSAPITTINTGNGNVIVSNGGTYTCTTATIVGFSDADNFAVLKVNGNYYWARQMGNKGNVLSNLTINNPGIYDVVAYDRNLNILEFTIIIEGDLIADAEGIDTQTNTASDTVRVYVTPYITEYQIQINGEEVALPLMQNEEGQYYYEFIQSQYSAKDVQVTAFSYREGEEVHATKTTTFLLSALLSEENENFYNLATSSNGNGTISSYSSVASEGQTVELSIVPNNGYQLKDILVNGVSIGRETSFVMPARNTTVVAEFESKTYQIIFAETTNGAASVVGEWQNAPFGSTVELSFNPSNGYSATPIVSINGISINGNSFVMPAEDVYITVTFVPMEAQMQNIYITPAANGTIMVKHNATQVLSGSEVELIIVPDNGYRFKEGSLKINGVFYNYANFIMPNEDVTITAEFEIMVVSYVVQIDSELENGAIIVNSKSVYESGEIVQLVITPNDGYRLVEDSLSANGTILEYSNFLMPNQNVLVTARFEKIPITAATGTINNGQVTFDSESYFQGDVVTIALSPDEGYRYKAGTLKVNGLAINGLSFIMPAGGADVSCEFELIPVAPKFLERTIDKVLFYTFIGLLGASVLAFGAVFIIRRARKYA